VNGWTWALAWLDELLAVGSSAVNRLKEPSLSAVANALVEVLTGRSISAWVNDGLDELIAELSAQTSSKKWGLRLAAARLAPSVAAALAATAPPPPTPADVITAAPIPEWMTIREWVRYMSSTLGIPAAQVLAIRRQGRSTLRGR